MEREREREGDMEGEREGEGEGEGKIESKHCMHTTEEQCMGNKEQGRKKVNISY